MGRFSIWPVELKRLVTDTCEHALDKKYVHFDGKSHLHREPGRSLRWLGESFWRVLEVMQPATGKPRSFCTCFTSTGFTSRYMHNAHGHMDGRACVGAKHT